MKRLLFIAFIPFILHAQWTNISGPGNTSITSMTKQGDALIVGTDLQGIHRTTDQGTTWRSINGNLSNFSVQSIFAQPSYILAGITAGSDKGMYQTTDNGVSWKKYSSPFANSTINCIFKVDTVILVGSSSVYRSTNNALSFQSSSSGIPAGNKITGFAAAGNTIIAAADGGLYRSTDLGASWTEVRKNTLYTELSYSITTGNGNFYVANQNGGVNSGKDSIYKSTDNGTTWISVKKNLPPYTYGQYLMAYGDTIFFGMQSENVYRSLNGGQSWQIDSVGMDNRRTHSGFIDGSVIYSGGNYYVSSGQSGYGGLYVSTNNGNSWTKKYMPMHMSMVNGFTQLGSKLIANASGQKEFGIFVSNDRGQSWKRSATTMTTNGNPAVFNNLIVKKGIIFAAATSTSGGPSGVYASIDTGTTWSAVNTGLTATTTAYAFYLDADTLYGCMKEGLYRTTNNGGTWEKWGVSGLPATKINSLIITNDTMYASNGTLKVYRSINRGRTWFGATSNQTIFLPERLYVHNNKFYTITSSNQGKFMICSDSGKTWTEVNAAFGQDVQSVQFVNDNIFARVYNKGIYLSTNAGTTWAQINQGMSTAAPVLSAMTIAWDTLFASYQDGGIIRRGLPDVGVTTVKRFGQTTAPDGFALSQNFPNPFNPSTRIEFSIPQSGFVTLNVYDAIGREVATVVREQMNAGSYSAGFNGAGLSSGVYFYQLKAGTYTAMKKMLLIK